MEEETKKELDEVTEYILHCTNAHIVTPNWLKVLLVQEKKCRNYNMFYMSPYVINIF